METFYGKVFRDEIIVNGFSIKETILDVLKLHKEKRELDDIDIEDLAEEIKEVFAIKMRLKQGKEDNCGVDRETLGSTKA